MRASALQTCLILNVINIQILMSYVLYNLYNRDWPDLSSNCNTWNDYFKQSDILFIYLITQILLVSCTDILKSNSIK